MIGGPLVFTGLDAWGLRARGMSLARRGVMKHFGLVPVLLLLIFASLSSDEGVRAEEPTCSKSVPKIDTKLPLVFCDDFEGGSIDRWELSDPKAWRLAKVDGNSVFEQFQASKVENPVRSPFNRALIKDVKVGSFVLDVKLQSTIKDYGHRDMCLFFGYQNPSHMYYVHLGKKTDDHANQIFIVNNAPRTKISLTTTPGTDWTDNWHHARIVRDVESGSIEVFFDDMSKPAMTAKDKTFVVGQVGAGTFDDTGRVDAVYLFGDKK